MLKSIHTQRLISFAAKLDAIELSDSRPRDGMGQYAPQESGAPDSNTMAAAYAGVMPEKQSRIQRIVTAWKNRKMFIPDNEPIQS